MTEWFLRTRFGGQPTTAPRCPRCGEGEIRVHAVVPVGFATSPPGAPVAAWIRCTRTKKCGWWRVLDPGAPEAV